MQFPKILTSYAVPPPASFSCPPCSVRKKGQNGPTHRWTYVALEAPEKKIQCFVDEALTSQKSSVNVPTLSYALENSESSVIALDIAPIPPTGVDFELLVIHKDGKVRILQSDLDVERWCGYPACNGSQDSNGDVQAAFIMSLDDAQKALLKWRPDIVATAMREGSNSSVLLTVSHSKEGEAVCSHRVSIHVYLIVNEDFAPAVKSLLSVCLPSHEAQQEMQGVQWDFNANTGSLMASFEKGVTLFDISKYTPEVTSSFVFDDGKLVSAARISPQSFLGVRDSTVAIYNTKFRSVQARIPLGDVYAISSSSKMKNRPSSVELLMHFPKLGIVVANCGTSLVAFGVPPVSPKETRDSLLINSIGRGIPSKYQNLILPSQLPSCFKADDDERWNQLKSELEQCAEAHNSAKFDSLIKSELPKFAASYMEGGSVVPSHTDRYDYEKLLFLLSLTFSINPKDSKLFVSFAPTHCFQWLMNAGCITLSNVEAALHRAGKLDVLTSLPPNALSQALADHRTVKGVLQYARSPAYITTDELVHIIKLLLTLARSYHTVGTAIHVASHALTDTTTPPSQVTNAVNRHDERVLDTVVASLNHTLIRLQSHPQAAFVAACRATLSHTDALAVIQHLRHALVTGGHTARFTGSGRDEHRPISGRIPLLPLSAIVTAMSGLIDAVGPVGWVSVDGLVPTKTTTPDIASDDDISNAENDPSLTPPSLFNDIRTEVSAALEGVQEATYLKGILREYVRHGEAISAATQGERIAAANEAYKAHCIRERRQKKREKAEQAELAEKAETVGKFDNDGANDQDENGHKEDKENKENKASEEARNNQDIKNTEDTQDANASKTNATTDTSAAISKTKIKQRKTPRFTIARTDNNHGAKIIIFTDNAPFHCQNSAANYGNGCDASFDANDPLVTDEQLLPLSLKRKYSEIDGLEHDRGQASKKSMKDAKIDKKKQARHEQARQRAYLARQMAGKYQLERIEL